METCVGQAAGKIRGIVYTEYFQRRERPFSITPDPAYMYLSPRHQEALGHLLYGTGHFGGFVQLTGEVGTGKTHGWVSANTLEPMTQGKRGAPPKAQK